MTTLSIARLDEIEDAASKATPGPWTRTGIQDVSGIGMHFAVGSSVGLVATIHADSVSEVCNTRDMIAALDPQTVLALVRIARAAMDSEYWRGSQLDHVLREYGLSP